MKRGSGRRLPLDYTGRCDTVLLRRELKWTITAALAAGGAGYLAAGAETALIGTGIGFLLQQIIYQVIVHELWRAWRNHATANSKRREYGSEPVTGEQMDILFEPGLVTRAFTLWMRLADWNDRLYVALWKYPRQADLVNRLGAPLEIDRMCYLLAEATITRAYLKAGRLGDEPRWCDTTARRRLRRTLQRDEKHLLAIAAEETGSDT